MELVSVIADIIGILSGGLGVYLGAKGLLKSKGTSGDKNDGDQSEEQ